MIEIKFDPNSAGNTWEPHPYDAEIKTVEIQKANFLLIAHKNLKWHEVNYSEFPESGIFGLDQKFFSKFDVEYTASIDDKQLILMANIYFGFPDPPQWRLAYSVIGEERWHECGYFADIPQNWTLGE